MDKPTLEEKSKIRKTVIPIFDEFTKSINNKLDELKESLTKEIIESKTSELKTKNVKILKKAIEESKTIIPNVQKIKGFVTAKVDNFPEIQKITGSVTVDNLPDKFKISNFPKKQKVEGKVEADVKFPDVQKVEGQSLEETVKNLEKLLSAMGTQQEVDKNDANPTKYITVRLSDGKKFYKALESALSGGGGGGLSFENREGLAERAVLDSSRNVKVRVEEETKKSLRMQTDSSNANVTYIGKARAGTPTTDAGWQIQKLDETTGTVITYADGDDSFDNKWSDRESLTYS